MCAIIGKKTRKVRAGDCGSEQQKKKKAEC